jgi:hypothetical protein
VEYIHFNPVRAGFVKRAGEWQWSSIRNCTESLSTAVSANRVLAVYCVLLLVLSDIKYRYNVY